MEATQHSSSLHPRLVEEWADERDVHTISSGSDYKAKWRCRDYGHLYVSPVKSRSKGTSCPFCSGRKVLEGFNDLGTTNAKLASEWNYERNEDSPRDVSAGSNKKAWWKCPELHEWESKISNRANGSKCPYCSGNKVLKGFNDLMTTHPGLAKDWNDEANIFTISAGSNKNIEWKCEKGHSYTMTPWAKVSGRSCPYCSGNKVLKGFNDLMTTHPGLAKDWNDSKSISTFSFGSNYLAQWECNEGHFYEMTIANKVYGQKCPYCAGKKTTVGSNDLATTHPHLVSEWNDPKEISTVFAKSEYEAQWKCSAGHMYLDAVYKVSRKQIACPYCSGSRVLSGLNDLATTHPHLVSEWRDERDISTISSGSNYQAKWECEKNHSWTAYVGNRSRGSGCPRCLNGTSRGEEEVIVFVEELGFSPVKDRVVLGGKELDLYIPEAKFAIEFNGVYWHTEKQGKDKMYHKNKFSLCRDQGIQLLTIWEDDWRDNKKAVKNLIAHKLKSSKQSKVYARETVFSTVPSREASDFLAGNHIQGEHRSSKYYGLRTKDSNKLVALMGIRNLKKKSEIEISRFATSTTVPGGFSKLLKNATSQERYASATKVVSYSHNDHSWGDVYEKNGFSKAHDGEPGYFYVVNGKREHRLNYSPKRFRERNDLMFEEGKTERELAALNGLERIWDCGSARWEKAVVHSSV